MVAGGSDRESSDKYDVAYLWIMISLALVLLRSLDISLRLEIVKRFLCGFFAFVALSLCLFLSGCIGCEDCGGELPPKDYMTIMYVNRTEKPVRMDLESASGESVAVPVILEVDDTLWAGNAQSRFGSKLIAHIVFGASQKTCLTFKEDTIDFVSDPRSHQAYLRSGNDYSYTFVDTLMSRAGACP